MRRFLSLLVGASALAMLLTCTSFAVAAGAPGSVTVVRVTYAGGGPPSTSKLGDVSTSSGNLYEPKGQMFLARLIGKWSYRCTYLGRLGQRGITHACSWEHTITGRGKIVVAGSLRWDSNAEQWFSITRVTGSFKGYTGVERQVNFNSDVGSGAFYLVKG